jgi:hypothetical protein
MLHTSPGREEYQVDQEERAQQVYTPLRLTGRQLQWAGAAVAILTIAILIGYPFGIKLWDWIELLIVPAVIAGGGLWFNRQQRERELEIAERRTQDDALQAYLDQMSDMLIPNKDQPSLYTARPGDGLSSLARARTLTVLKRPKGDDEGKAQVVQFLYESGLTTKDRCVIDLNGADLDGANLLGFDIDLKKADLRSTHLRKARLIGTRLYEADLRGAYLDEADLRGPTSTEPI